MSFYRPISVHPLPDVAFTDAEGNGDSISAAVQAERIALLTSVLTQGQTMPSPATMQNTLPPSHAQRSHSLTPPQRHHQFVEMPRTQMHLPAHRSRSQLELNAQYAQPIYQTSGPRQPSPFPVSTPSTMNQTTYTPAPLLPSFLQDIVQSPTDSPTTTSPSSVEFSLEEYDDCAQAHTSSRTSSGSTSNLASSNIWKLDGDETKGLSGVALPNRQDLMGGSRKGSREMLRRPHQPSMS